MRLTTPITTVRDPAPGKYSSLTKLGYAPVGDPEIVVAVGAIVLRDGRLLMVKRRNEPGRGLWSIPGGRLEPGELLAAAVRREVREETGLEVEVRDLIGILEVPGEPHYVIHDYAAVTTTSDEAVAAGDAEEVRWVPLDEITGLECTPRFVETLQAWGVLASADE